MGNTPFWRHSSILGHVKKSINQLCPEVLLRPEVHFSVTLEIAAKR
jgi:hypothetical protein